MLENLSHLQQSLPSPYVASTSFEVSWSATDSGSGVDRYDVQKKVGDGSWQPWKMNTALTSSNFTGQDGTEYSFRVRARDRVGNESVWSAAVTTRVDVSAPSVDLGAPPQAPLLFTVSWAGCGLPHLTHYICTCICTLYMTDHTNLHQLCWNWHRER